MEILSALEIANNERHGAERKIAGLQTQLYECEENLATAESRARQAEDELGNLAHVVRERDAALASLAAAEETHRGECAACQAECAICERGQPAATYSRAVDEVFEWIETNSWRTAETREERAARFLTSRKEHG
jgi:chromosome segregation ATPase